MSLNPYSYKWFRGDFIIDNLTKYNKNMLVSVANQAALGPPFGYIIKVDLKATDAQKRDAVAKHLRDIGEAIKIRDKVGDPAKGIEPKTEMIYFITKIESRDKVEDAEFEFRGWMIQKKLFMGE